jgi:D-alanyl-D-alanine carboxypeptidase
VPGPPRRRSPTSASPYFKPGQGWHYSNTNYVVLGLLAETIEGAPLAEQLHARFLTPLGLGHTHYQGVDAPQGPLARAYRFDGPGLRLKPIPLTDGTDVVPFTSVVTAAGSAGSIASTAKDLVTWAHALYGGTVLSPVSFAAMVTGRPAHDRVQAIGAVRAGCPGGDHRRATHARPLRTVPRRAIGRALAAERGDRHRGA